MKDYIRLVVSDLHLGSVNSKEGKLLELLCEEKFDELILAGDIIDFIRVPTFTEQTAEILNKIHELGKKVVYVIGNHDIGMSKFAGKTIGDIQFVNKYEFEYFNRKYKIVHGHQFDTGVTTWHYFMNFLSIMQDWAERAFGWNLASWYVNWRPRS